MNDRPMNLTPSHRIRPILEHRRKENVALSQAFAEARRRATSHDKVGTVQYGKTAKATQRRWQQICFAFPGSWEMVDDVITTEKHKLRRTFCQQSDFSMVSVLFFFSFLRAKRKIILLQQFARSAGAFAYSYFYLFWTAPPKSKSATADVDKWQSLNSRMKLMRQWTNNNGPIRRWILDFNRNGFIVSKSV